MYRQDREITDEKKIIDIIKSSIVCRLAFHNFPAPYIIPMNYGYYNGSLYLHCANKGLKLDLLTINNNVGFEIESQYSLVTRNNSTSMVYKSIIGEGLIYILDNNEDKQIALKHLIEHHGGEFKMHSEMALNSVTMLKLDIKKITAKENL